MRTVIKFNYYVQGGSLARPNSILRVDPEDRCAALLVYSRQLVIIPFMRRDAVFDDGLSEKPDVKVWRNIIVCCFFVANFGVCLFLAKHCQPESYTGTEVVYN